MPHLRRGDLLPRIVTPPPGPRSRALAGRLEAFEAPGINTLTRGPAGPVPSLVWSEARGSNVLDLDGNRFLDLTSGFGVAAVGHRHPRVVAAVHRQSSRLLHGLGDVHAHPLRVELAARLCERTPVDEPRVYFATSGAEAVEIALKTALLATGRSGVVAFEPAYHGVTLGALAVTSRPEFRSPFASWMGAPVFRLPYGVDPADLEKLLETSQTRIGSVIFEPVAGREGGLFPPSGWVADIARCAHRYGVVVISDEIFVGFGRTGRWFGVDEDGVRPDLLVCGKALGGGLPVAAVVGRRDLMASWRTPGEALHTSTFVAHPLACAAALATLDVLAGGRNGSLVDRAARLGRGIAARLAPLPSRFAGLSEIRGRGLLWALELKDAETAKRIVAGLLSRGVLALAGGVEGRVIQLNPPLTISERQLGTAIDLLEETVDRETAGGRG